jgi:hypothetical protein
VVYEQLSGGDPDIDSEDLLARAREHSEEGDEFPALETAAFAILLGQLE